MKLLGFENMRNITLGTTYYNNPSFLIAFVDHHLDFVDELIIVDDGSPNPASEVIKQHPKIKLYRVTKDYGFNSHGCRNLIMKESANEWVVLLDLDRKFLDPTEAFDVIKNKKLKNSVMYKFVAYNKWTKDALSSIHISVNDFLIHREHFFSAGGYDEELIGVRNGDRQYFVQLEHFGTEQLLPSVEIQLTRRPSLQLKNKKGLSSKDRGMSMAMHNLLQKRMAVPEPNKPILTFAWERVF